MSLFSSSPSTPKRTYDLGPGILFASSSKSPTNSPFKYSNSPGISFHGSPNESNYERGYFAFPAGYSDNNLAPKVEPEPVILVEEHSSLSPSTDPPERVSRISREEEEARRGEEEWVKNGGILRDANGVRDFKRTEELRAELKLREVERVLKERWDTYESRWKELATKKTGADNSITFDDIPWPVALKEELPSGKYTTKKRNPIPKKIELADLTTKNVEDFLLGPLSIRGSTISRKERIRMSLLRWHPDKLTGLLSRVTEDDKESVENGIGIVVRALHDLNK